MSRGPLAAISCMAAIGLGLCFWLLLFLALWLTRGWWGG